MSENIRNRESLRFEGKSIKSAADQDGLPRDLRTKAFVLRRTNYGEADRILNLITPEGKFSVMAKGARREKSKLAGGIELFTLSDVSLHFGKSEFGVLTGAKMVEYYNNLVIDLERLELAARILKRVERGAEGTDSPRFFDITKQSLSALNREADTDLVETWFLLNFAAATGGQINLSRDIQEQKLDAGKTYVWNSAEEALEEQLGGNVKQNEIKLMRLMLSSKLDLILKVKNIQKMIPSCLFVARAVNNI